MQRQTMARAGSTFDFFCALITSWGSLERTRFVAASSCAEGHMGKNRLTL
jgi:hypothetical protein